MQPRLPRRALALAALLTLGPAALAQSFDFSLDELLSDTLIGSDVSLPLPGSAIGNYEPTSNPTGTITCTNLFGSCANTSFAITTTLLAETNLSGHPSGGFRATIDTNTGVVLISGLNVAALGKQPGATDLTLEIGYPTFRTQQPNSLFIGGFTLPLPLGQGTVDDVLLVQTGGAVPGVLTPTGTPDLYDVTALVPAELSFELDLLGNVTPVGPLPFALPVVGTLDLSGPAPLFSLFVDQQVQQVVPNPLPGQVLEDIPFPLPTILPPGGTANLLLDLIPGDLTLALLADLAWYAAGTPTCSSSAYCSSTPNTFSSGAQVASGGSSSLTFNNFTLSATGVPPGHAGRFYMGTKQVFTPFGDGHLCVSGSTRRFPVIWADATGAASYTLDFLDPAQPSSLIAPGSSWNFQLVFRDPIGGPLTFNTSDALAVTFCP